MSAALSWNVAVHEPEAWRPMGHEPAPETIAAQHAQIAQAHSDAASGAFQGVASALSDARDMAMHVDAMQQQMCAIAAQATEAAQAAVAAACEARAVSDAVRQWEAEQQEDEEAAMVLLMA